MFFGYFLNTKKVTPSADFVIGPAKAEAFLFSHTRLPFPPRPLLPFGRISPAAKPRVRLPAPPFGFAAQKRARHFAARNHPVRLSASRPWLRHPAPLFCRSRHGCAAPGPQRQNPGPCSRSVAFRLRRNRAGRSLPPPGATCSLPHFRFAQMWPRARTPALPPFRLRTSSFSAHFSAQKCPRRAMLSHSSRRGRPFALFHRAGAAFGTLTAAAAPPPSWSRRPLHIPCPPF